MAHGVGDGSSDDSAGVSANAPSYDSGDEPSGDGAAEKGVLRARLLVSDTNKKVYVMMAYPYLPPESTDPVFETFDDIVKSSTIEGSESDVSVKELCVCLYGLLYSLYSEAAERGGDARVWVTRMDLLDHKGSMRLTLRVYDGDFGGCDLTIDTDEQRVCMDSNELSLFLQYPRMVTGLFSR